MRVLKARNEGEVLTKSAKIVLKEIRHKIGDSTRKLSHSWQAKTRNGHESCLKCLKFEAPEMAKKYICLVCQITPSSSQICKEVKKPCCGRGLG